MEKDRVLLVRLECGYWGAAYGTSWNVHLGHTRMCVRCGVAEKVVEVKEREDHHG